MRAEVAIQALIDSGSTIARFYQGMIFQTKQEWEKAYACYHSDNLSRYAPALYQLGTLFQSDRCTKTEPKRLVFGKNVGEELRWYKAAALCGHEQALLAIHARDPSNNALAALYLAELYQSGSPNLSADSQRALEYYALAARLDHTEALAILVQRANLGDPASQHALGYEYYHKLGKTAEGICWCIRAAEKGHALALTYLNSHSFNPAIYNIIGGIYSGGGTEIAVNLDKAIEFYNKAQNAGDTDALLILGSIYESAMPKTDTNIEMACRYYLKALSRGCLEAIDSLTRVTESASRVTQRLIANALHPHLHDISPAPGTGCQTVNDSRIDTLFYAGAVPVTADNFIYTP